jgi:site-specific recombinase XerD
MIDGMQTMPESGYVFRRQSFRVAIATDLCEQGVPDDEIQTLLGHSDVRTTNLYKRNKRGVTRNLVERIRLGR